MTSQTWEESNPSLITLQYLNSIPTASFVWLSKPHQPKKSELEQECFIHEIASHRPWDEDCQEQLLNETLLHPRSVNFPPSQIYQKHFLKFIIDRVESNSTSCSETIYSMYIDLLNVSRQEQAHKSYYLPDLKDFVTLRENTRTLSSGTTGLVTWKGGLFLAEWCLSNQHLVTNRHVLELGSGCGVSGIVVAKCVQVKSFTFTDFHHDVLDQLKCNVEINELNPDKFRVKRLDWENDECDVIADVVLAADVVFEPAIVPCLVRTISHVLTSCHCIAFIACTVRNIATYNVFIREIESKNLKWKLLETDDVKNIFLYDRDTEIRILQITT